MLYQRADHLYKQQQKEAEDDDAGEDEDFIVWMKFYKLMNDLNTFWQIKFS